MFKKISAYLLIILMTVLCFGCATTTYQVSYLEDGSIEQSFSVALDEEALSNAGYSLTESVLNIRTLFNTYWNNKCSAWQENLNNNQTLSTLQKQTYLNSVTHRINLENSVISITINYSDPSIISVLNNNGEQETETSSSTQEKHLFYTKVIMQEGKNAYYGFEESTLYSELISYYSTGSESFNENDVTMQQVLTFTQSRIHSNADAVVEKNGTYYHVWNVKSDEPTANVVLYRIYARPALWYVVILGVVVAFVVVSLIVAKKKEKTLKPSKNDETNNII